MTKMTASEAWKRATEMGRSESLDIKVEPRIRAAANAPEEVSADHPFFWAGYMLVDTGAAPNSADDEVPVEAEVAEVANDIGDEAATEDAENAPSDLPKPDDTPPADPVPTP